MNDNKNGHVVVPEALLVQVHSFLIAVKQMHVVDSLGTVFLLGATFWLDEFA